MVDATLAIIVSLTYGYSDLTVTLNVVMRTYIVKGSPEGYSPTFINAIPVFQLQTVFFG